MGNLKVPRHIESLVPYPPGKPIDELKRELGLTRVIKLASNENPFGASPMAKEAIRRCLDELHRYPDGSGYYLKNKLAARLGQSAERIVLGCGTNEVIDLICRVFVGPGGRAVLPHPSFLVYQKFLQASGAEAILVPLHNLTIDLAAMRAAVGQTTRLVVVCNPNNPTGTVLRYTQLKQFADSLPDGVVLLVDEAYSDFVREPGASTALDLIADDANIVVSRTFSKAYGLAGLRIGYGVMPAGMASYLDRVRQPFNITSPALAAAEAALDDDAYLEEVKNRTWSGLDHLLHGLTGMGFEVGPSQANFILFRAGSRAETIYRGLLKRGMIIRPMSSFGLGEYLRVSVGTEEENGVFLSLLAEVLEESGA